MGATFHCFVAGSRIKTSEGYRNVEDLTKGDVIETLGGTAKALHWLGRSSVTQINFDPVAILPIRIKAGALDHNVPCRDLLLSPGHGVFIKGTLVVAGALVNGTSIVRETAVAPVFVYYHIELDDHHMIDAEGAPVESLLMTSLEYGYDNMSERAPREDAAKELAFPRVKSARQMPQAIRQHLAQRAAIIAPDLAVAA